MYNKPLPIGSVIRLAGEEKRYMILGYLRYARNDHTKIFDYSGCPYPEGFLSPTDNFVFNHESIKSIYALGYCDQKQERFTELLMEDFKNAKGKTEF